MKLKTGSKSIYLVIDPAMDANLLFPKLEEALTAGVDILQIWNHWPEGLDFMGKTDLVNDIIELARPFSIPVLINDDYHLLKETELQGIHFDEIPENWLDIKAQLSRKIISGITCGNFTETIKQAVENGFDYISFCSMFPSSSVDTCEIVRPESVANARKITSLPIFLAGGINLNNLQNLSGLDFQGVAVISGIMSADSPVESIRKYRQALDKL